MGAYIELNEILEEPIAITRVLITSSIFLCWAVLCCITVL